jgi:hypothetical protein
MGGGAGAYLLATSLLRVDETRLLIARLRRFVQ